MRGATLFWQFPMSLCKVPHFYGSQLIAVSSCGVPCYFGSCLCHYARCQFSMAAFCVSMRGATLVRRLSVSVCVVPLQYGAFLCQYARCHFNMAAFCVIMRGSTLQRNSLSLRASYYYAICHECPRSLAMAGMSGSSGSSQGEADRGEKSQPCAEQIVQIECKLTIFNSNHTK